MKDEELDWITVNHVHIPIKPGQTKDEAVKESFKNFDKSDWNDKKEEKEEKFDSGKQKYRFIKTWHGTYLRDMDYEPNYTESLGNEIEIDPDDLDVDAILNNENFNLSGVKTQIAKYYGVSLGEGEAILNKVFKDKYNKIKKERENAKFKTRTEAADKFLDGIGKSELTIESIDTGANLKNYNECQDKYSHIEIKAGWLRVNGIDVYKSDWKVRVIDNARKYDEYTSNCQRCVTAWYLRHLGYDVEAMPYDSGESNRSVRSASPNLMYKKDGLKYYSKNWSFSAFNVPEDTEYDFHGFDKEWQSTQHKRISEIVSKAPNNSVFFCSVAWRGSDSAHVFVVHNDNGKARFFDPQTNKDASKYFIGVDEYGQKYKLITHETTLLRVDNLSLNGDILPEIVRKTKGE